MVLAVHGELVSTARASRGQHAQALHEVNLKRLQKLWLPRAQFSRPPLPSHAPCPYLLPYLSSRPPRVPALTGRLSHPRALGGCGRDHSAAAWAMARGAEPWLERRRLILQPIQPPQNTGTTCHDPHLAPAHYLPHACPSRLWSTMSSRRAAALSSLSLPAACSKSAASSSWSGRPILRERRAHARPPSRLGRVERSFGACAPRGWVVSYFG